jgi:hypothetical protein
VKVRRVVTGEDAAGTAVFAKVDDVDSVDAGSVLWHGVWGWDELPTLPVNPTGGYSAESVFPPPGGLRVQVVTFAPQGHVSAGEGAQEFRRMLDAQPSGVLFDEDDRAQHRTDTIEVAFVLEGEIVVEGGDQAEVTLRRGDCLIQNGAMHAWRNRSGAPATLGIVIMPAQRRVQ